MKIHHRVTNFHLPPGVWVAGMRRCGFTGAESGTPCRQLVRDEMDHCSAGHPAVHDMRTLSNLAPVPSIASDLLEDVFLRPDDVVSKADPSDLELISKYLQILKGRRLSVLAANGGQESGVSVELSASIAIASELYEELASSEA